MQSAGISQLSLGQASILAISAHVLCKRSTNVLHGDILTHPGWEGREKGGPKTALEGALRRKL